MVVAPSASASPANNPPASRDSSRYQPVNQDENGDNEDDAEFGKLPRQPMLRTRQDTRYRNATYFLSLLVVLLLASNLYATLPYSFRRGPSGSGSDSCPGQTGRVPQYFQTSPELWPGPTATGRPAFMAQTRVFEPTATFVPNEPLQTSIPIDGMKEGDDSIFKMMGFLSPYSPSPGFGVDEYPLPDGADIVQVQMLSRHGARYPTGGSDVEKLGKRIAEAGESFTPKGNLSFLKDWKYELGAEILVPRGRQELYDSGRMHSYTAIGLPITNICG